jgi:zeaxanthin glucosyltransferase
MARGRPAGHTSHMSTIAFWMIYEEGHLLPTFRLASSLQARGHRICYFTLPDYEDLVTGHGFEHVPLFEEMYPRGELSREQRFSAAELAARNRDVVDLYHRYFVVGVADQRLHQVSPDLLLCDMLDIRIGMAAWHWKIPFLRVCTSLPQTPDPGIPPLTSGLPFDDSPVGRAAAERAWDERMRQDQESVLYEPYMRLHEDIRRRYGFPAELLDPRATFMDHMVGFPELVLCSPALDYPRPPVPWRHYGESLWLARSEPDFPWQALDPDRPLIYCSLGSQAHRAPGARRFFAEVVALAARKPEWQLVIAHGVRLTAADLGDVPDNAVLVPFAPQLALLRRSRLAIIHGGLGTLKECMSFGVPVLVFPWLTDQPGNAARVEYHRLGRAGNYDTATAAEILALAQHVLDDAEIPRRIAAVQRALIELEETQPGLALVEQMLAAG